MVHGKRENSYISRITQTLQSAYQQLALCLMPKQNSGHAMHDYAGMYHQKSTQPALINAQIEERLLVTMFVRDFGSRSKVPFGTVVSALLTIHDFAQQIVTVCFCKSRLHSKVRTSWGRRNWLKRLSLNLQRQREEVRVGTTRRVAYIANVEAKTAISKRNVLREVTI